MKRCKIIVCLIGVCIVLYGCCEKKDFLTTHDIVSNQSQGELCYIDDMVYFLEQKNLYIKSNEIKQQVIAADIFMIQQYQTNIYCIEQKANKNVFYKVDGKELIYICDLPDGNCTKFVVNLQKAFFSINAVLYCLDMANNIVSEVNNNMNIIDMSLTDNKLYCAMGIADYGEKFDFSDIIIQTKLYVYDTNTMKKQFVTNLGNSGVLMSPVDNGVLCQDIGAMRTLYVYNGISNVLFEDKSIFCIFSNKDTMYYGDSETGTFHRYSLKDKTDNIIYDNISIRYVKGITSNSLHLSVDNYIYY